MTEQSSIHLHVMGEHWLEDLSALSRLGRLVSRAKDQDEVQASEIVCRLLGEFVSSIPRLAGHPSQSGNAMVVAAVPSSPTSTDHLATLLGEAVAESLDQHLDRELIARHHQTARLRDTEPSKRRIIAERAGYEVTRPLNEASVLLVDDVIMTGTTVGLIAELLVEAGAASVDVVVASRTVRRG